MFANVEQTLKKSGYKVTPQRRIVLKAISENADEHLSSEEIFNIVKVTNPEIGLATVYRTLQLFTRLGILSRLNLDDNISRYELILEDEAHTHHHLICDRCGKIYEVHEDLLDALEQHVKEKYGFEVRNHKLKFFGVCSNCNK